MTNLNENTKAAQSMISSYINTTKGSSIYKAYRKPSAAKVEAYDKIKKEMNVVGGYGFRITKAGSSFFSCAYLVNYIADGETEATKYLIYHTAHNVYRIKYDA